MKPSEKIFSKIGIAIAFSPRCEALLAEAKHLQNCFQSQLYFIHVGKNSLQETQYLKLLMHRFHLDDPSNKIVWREGDPVTEILEICLEEKIDLLVAGALEKESILKYILGGVARQLSRKIKCSMLMLTEPSLHPIGFKKLVVEGTDHPKTENTISIALEIAKVYESESVAVIQETNLQKMALIRNEELMEKETEGLKESFEKEELQKLDSILNCKDCGNLNIHTERIEGKPGFVINTYARENQADLLVINGPDKPLNLLDRVFPHDIEYLLSDLPCNLLIIHSKDTE
ncbi:MAG: universal stress protein [Bacteroidia bacterium]|nr:universal stress protein [Bacteroidia bacterium]MCF8427432.1 universal stress protein [Bacteroidia bacterium]